LVITESVRVRAGSGLPRAREEMQALNRARALAAAVLCTAAVAGCGEEDDYENQLRPPSPIVVSAAVTDSRVSVSPKSFGAGPVNLIVTNQTERAQEITLETDEIGGSEPGIQQRTGPINPGDTASLKADLKQGTYRVATDSENIRPAALAVGDSRPSAQDELLQP
jgi:hypothetical protein